MKKSNTLFTLAFFAILAFSSCEREQWGNAQKGPDDIDNRGEGQIGLSALKVSVDELLQLPVQESIPTISLSAFTIWIKKEKWCKSGNAARCPKYSR